MKLGKLASTCIEGVGLVRADGVAVVRLKELEHPLGSQIAMAKTLAISRVDLGVCIKVVYTLDVTHQCLTLRPAIAEVAEGL